MPTSTELRMLKMSWLENLISRNNGFVYWANKLNLEMKKTTIKWNKQKIKDEILRIKEELKLDIMPTREQIITHENNGCLHSAICRTGGYRIWAEKLNLELKESESKDGWEYEDIIFDILNEKSYVIQKMTTKHPYDLLVNNKIKIDVKMARPFYSEGCRWHTFGINKKYATCDIYIIVEIDDNEKIEKIFIIPGYELRVTTLSIGHISMYDKYIDRWDIIEQFDNLYKNLII